MNKIASQAINTLATSILLCLSFTAQAQYNPNIQQNYQGGLNPLDWQTSAAGAAAAASAAASSGMNAANNAANSAVNNAAASYQQNASAQFLQSSAPASAFGQSGTGYTNDGTLMMGGQKIGNPHQILHDAEVPSFMNITATRYTYTNDPTHGQGTLAQMEAATSAGSGCDLLLNRLYLTPNNPYVGQTGSPYPNLATYAAVLKDAQKTNYLPTAADDGKIYVFKTLSTASTQSQNILIKELPNTSTFKAAADPLGGGVGVRVTQNGDAVALQNYLATVKPYDFSWQSAFGPYAAMANTGGPVVFGANGNVNGINPYVEPASFYFNWVMGSDQVQGFQTQLNNESKQTGNEGFGQLVWDSNTNQYVMLGAGNQKADANSVSGTMPTLGQGQTGIFGMHTHPDGSQPSNQDLRQAAALGSDQVIVGSNGMNYVVLPGGGGIGGGEFRFETGYLGGRPVNSFSTGGSGASNGPQHGYVVIGANYIGDPNALIVSYGKDQNGYLVAASSNSDLNRNDRNDWLKKQGDFNILVDKSGYPVSDDKLSKAAIDLTNYLNNTPTVYDPLKQNSNSAAISIPTNAGAYNPQIPSGGAFGFVVGNNNILPPPTPITYPSVDAFGIPTGGYSTY